jgi:endogenous inhibitor of DNA gyrase (YacG/DUF329 family)
MACRPLCAYCRQRPMESPWAPFCSQRCKDVDLGRWLRGDYRAAGDRDDPAARAAGDRDDPADRAAGDRDDPADRAPGDRERLAPPDTDEG